MRDVFVGDAVAKPDMVDVSMSESAGFDERAFTREGEQFLPRRHF